MFGSGSKKKVLGIDVGAKTTKIVQLKFSGKGQPELEVCEILSTGTADETFTANLKGYFADQDLKGSYAALSVDDESLHLRKFEMPVMPDGELREALRWNFREFIDDNVDDYHVTFTQLNNSVSFQEDQNEYMAYAVSKKFVSDFKVRFESLGLSVIFIEPKDVTLASALDRSFPDDEHFYAGLEVDYSASRFYVIGRREFVFTRRLIGVDYESFEKDPGSYRQKLAIELQKSIDTFQVNFKMQPLHSLHLSGQVATLTDLPEYLQTNLGIDAQIFNPFSNLVVPDQFQDVTPQLFVQAVSLAFIQP